MRGEIRPPRKGAILQSATGDASEGKNDLGGILVAVDQSLQK